VDQPDPDPPLREIETHWSDVLRASRPDSEANTARSRLVLQYIAAVQQYMARVLRNDEAAAELAQEFAVRVLRGDFRRADPARGRFRDFLRIAALNLVNDYRRRSRSRQLARRPEALEPAAPQPEADEPDAEFLQTWRMELFRRSMASLDAYQRRTGRPYHDLISLRSGEPQPSSAQMAAALSVRLGKPLSEGWVRQTLRRARECLADLLLDEVSISLEGCSIEELEQELIILDLLDYCRESLRRRARRNRAAD
jgi:RNA polymerase sigma-70 factor (ECF subfamily)